MSNHVHHIIYMFYLSTTPCACTICLLIFHTWCQPLTRNSSPWLQILLIALSNDVHQNPGAPFHNSFFTFMSWNVNSIAKDNFQRVRLIEAHKCETSLNDQIYYLMTILLCPLRIQQTLDMAESVCSLKIPSLLRSEMICLLKNR